ncbi:hypothetical protein F66182_17921, partial [Fusarium sp. NRRL 66182]
MEVAAPGVATNGLAAATAPVAVADPYAVVRYLTDVLQVTLGASKRDLEAAGSLLSKAKYSETVQKCTRFASESQVALYVQQDIFSAEQPNGTESDEVAETRYTYTLAAEVSFLSTTVASVAFIKRPGPIDPSQPIATQIQVTNFPGLSTLSNAQAQQAASISAFEILHSLVHHTLGPYFEAYTRGQEASNGIKQRTETEAKTGVPGAKKRIAELDLAFLHLQQNVEIPTLNLPLHEIVQAALDEAETRGVKPSVD